MVGMAAALALTTLVAATVTTPPTAKNNLNGANYRIANMPQLGDNISLLARSELYFDVYTDVIASLYSEVQWSTHPVPFPPDFVKSFDGTSNLTDLPVLLRRRPLLPLFPQNHRLFFQTLTPSPLSSSFPPPLCAQAVW
jgi:hypothetical protein